MKPDVHNFDYTSNDTMIGTGRLPFVMVKTIDIHYFNLNCRSQTASGSVKFRNLQSQCHNTILAFLYYSGQIHC